MRELVSITECERFSVLIRAYIDDSKDERAEKVVVAGAFMGWYRQWSKLREHWKKRLKRDGLGYYRSTEYYSLRGEFGRYRDNVKYPKPTGSEAAGNLRTDLDAIIHKYQIMGMAVCVPVASYKHFRATQAHASQIFPDDPFQAAIQSLLRISAETVRDEITQAGPHKIAFICDLSPDASDIASLYADFARTNADIADYMAGLTHQNDKLVPPLQAADLMASIAKERFLEWLDDPSPTSKKEALRSRLHEVGVSQIAVWDDDFMTRLLASEKQKRGL